MRRFLFPLSLAALSLGCDVEPPAFPARYPIIIEGAGAGDGRGEVLAEYGRTVDRIAGMVHDEDLQQRVQRRGLNLVNVAWEDTGRYQGSSIGPNISDLTLQVRRADGAGRFRDTLMPVIRYPNFTDHTGDVPSDRFYLRVGNHGRSALRTVPLTDVLRDLRAYTSSPETLPGDNAAKLDLLADRDTHFLVSAQAVFLPIPRSGKATFNPVVFNYQSAPGSPAVLVLLATREGTSVQVIENRPEDTTVERWGQELYFNDHGNRAAFTAERRSEVAARIAAQGGPRSEADRSALGKGADVMALIQVPLVHANRGALGGGSSTCGDGYCYQFSDDPLAAGGFGPNDAAIRSRSGDVERAVLGHGPRLGPFLEGRGARLVRDTRFPIRITVQFYKATSDGVVKDSDLDSIQRSIRSAYDHADVVGSLVVPEGDPARPTAWQRVPGGWFPW